MLENLKSKKINSIIVAFAFVFNLCIFAPLEFYYSNVFDLWFTVDNVLPIILGIGVLFFSILFSISYFTKGKIHDVIIKLIFILMLCLYIQGNYLNVGYDVLNGTQVDWYSMIGKGIINTIIWGTIILLVFIIKPLKKPENYRFITNVLSIFIVVIEIITLTAVIFIGYVYNTDSNYDYTTQFYLDENSMFNLSSEENIIVFVSDTFEGNYMNFILEKYPEYKEKLKDFTYFDNTTGTSLMTFSAMPTILTGESCQVGYNLKENINYCFENTDVYNVLESNGYDVDLYTYTNLIPAEDNGAIDNKVNKKVLLDTSDKMKLSSLLYDCVLYKYMPHFLKSGFLINTSDFNSVSSTQVSQYVLDDVKFYDKLNKTGINNGSQNKKFKLYHLSGIHNPYILTEDIKYNKTKEYLSLSEDERRENQILGSINLFIEYIEKLKETNTYDNTTIILLADHGWENRYYINLLVKPKGTDSEFSVSHAPISILEDYIPTILNIASASKDYGKDIWDYNENEERTRNIYNYTFTRGDNTYNVLSKLTITTTDSADKIDSYYISNAEYANSSLEPKKEYEFGKEVNILKNKNMKYAVLEGILESNIRTISKGTNIGKEANIKIKAKLTENDVNATFLIKEVYHDNQRVRFSINETVLHEETLNKTDINKEINFTIPKELWNGNEILELKVEFPDGRLGDAYYLGEETIFMSVLLESLKFEN